MASGKPKVSYPDELNPFGDEDDHLYASHKSFLVNRRTKLNYPDQLNPFDIDDEVVDKTQIDNDDYDSSFNPFASDPDTNDVGVSEHQMKISKNSREQRPQSSLSKIDYDNSLNPFDEDEEDDTTQVPNIDARKDGQQSRYSSGYSSSILPVANNEDKQASLINSPLSQPNLSVNIPIHPKRMSPSKRPKKRVAPKPPTEQSPVHNDDRPLSMASPECDDKPMQYSIISDDNPSLSCSSIHSLSSPSPVIQEVQQPLPVADEHGSSKSPEYTEDDQKGRSETSDEQSIASNSQLSQPTSNRPDLPIKPSPLMVPSPAIRRSLNSMSSMNHSSSSISSQKESPSTYPSCRSHDGSMTNINDDPRPKPLPRTKSLLKKEGRLSMDTVKPPPQDLKEKLENLESTPSGQDDNSTSTIEASLVCDITMHLNNDSTIDDIQLNTTQDVVSNEIQDTEASSSIDIGERSTSPEEIKHSLPDTGQDLVTEVNEDINDIVKSHKEKSINGSVKSLDEHNDDRNAALWRKIGLKKRAAPPLPVNFKRQVFGSLVEIEVELNEIGDNLVDIEKQFMACRMEMLTERLKTNGGGENSVDTTTPNRLKFIELVRKKCDLARRQKDLMYRKREHILDQSHSDIEYELRMIGNKQASHRTDQDDQREQELLKRLVEIIEEKNDIVENLIKDNSISDEDELNEALKRLDIKLPTSESFLGQPANFAKDCDRKIAASNLGNATLEGEISKQDKTKTKHRPSTAKAFKTLKKYGKVVVKMSKKDEAEPKSSATKTSL